MVVPLTPLTEEALVRILTEPKNALVKQYKHFFQMENAELEFTDGALSAIAQKAMARDTGARALRAILEEVMLDLMYELPDSDAAGKRYIIDEDVIDGPQNPRGPASPSRSKIPRKPVATAKRSLRKLPRTI